MSPKLAKRFMLASMPIRLLPMTATYRAHPVIDDLDAPRIVIDQKRPAPTAHRSLARGPAPGAAIKYGVAVIGVGAYQVLEKLDGFLSRVGSQLARMFRKSLDRLRKLKTAEIVSSTLADTLCLTVSFFRHFPLNVIRFPLCFLRVVCRLSFPEHQYTLMDLERLSVGIREIGPVHFVPNPLTSEQLGPRHDELGREGLGGCQDDSALRLQHT